MKELKHIQTIDSLNKAVELRKQTLATAKELRSTIEQNNCTHSITKGESFNCFNLIKNGDSDPILYNAYTGKVKSYINLHGIDSNKVFGKELVYDNLPQSDEYKTYDDYIDNIEGIMGTYAELRNAIDHEYSTYSINKYKDGYIGHRYALSNTKTKEVLIDDVSKNVIRYIQRNGIEMDDIFQGDLLINEI